MTIRHENSEKLPLQCEYCGVFEDDTPKFRSVRGRQLCSICWNSHPVILQAKASINFAFFVAYLVVGTFGLVVLGNWVLPRFAKLLSF